MAVISVELMYTGVVFLGTFTVAYFAMERKRIKSKGNNSPPNLPALPIIGSFPFLTKMEELHVFLTDKATNIGNVFGFHLASRYAIVLNGREAIHDALVKHSLDFANRAEFSISRLFNKNLSGIGEHPFNADFRRYHQLSLNIFKEFGYGDCVMESRIHAEIDELVQELSALKNKPVHPEDLVTIGVLNVMASILLGTRFKQVDSEADIIINVARTFIRDSVDCSVANFFPFLKYLPKIKNTLHRNLMLQNQFFDLMDEKIAKSQIEGAPENFIKRFIEAEGPSYDHDQLRYLLRDFFMAGTDTSSTTLQWAFVALADHQEIQKRLQVAIDAVVPRDRLPSYSDRPAMPYVEATVLELMRWKTIVPLAVPHETLNDTSVLGYSIPAGTLVFPNLYSAHMDPKDFPNPEIFEPERFLDAAGKVVNKEKMVTFSLGRRSCLGELLARQEVFLFFAGLLQRFHILPLENSDQVKVHEIVGTTVSPSFYEVRFIPREILTQ